MHPSAVFAPVAGARRWTTLAAACVILVWEGAARADDDDAPDADDAPLTQPSPPPPEPPVEPPPSPPAIDPPPPSTPRSLPPPGNKPEYRVGLFESVFTNLFDSVSGYNLLWHGAAIGSTVALSASGADDEVQRWFWRDNTIFGGTVTDAAFISGWFTPVVIPGAVALTGLAADSSKAASGGVTALQAIGINAVVIQLTKFVTGRPLPYEDGVPNPDDRIKRSGDGREWFSFGGSGLSFGGVAWPSGHTSSHMALASSLVAFFREEKWLPFVAYPLAVGMGLAMVEGDHHWLSDVVAGGLSGHAIGWTVGKNMRRKYDAAHGAPTADGASSVNLRPIVTSDAFLLSISFDPHMFRLAR